jgi:CHASE3 domain sensor protein
MQNSIKRFGILTGFAVMLALLLANAIVIRKQLATQLSNQEWVAHTRQVQQELLSTESSLRDAESSQRGYLYTGDLKYLAPYETARTSVVTHLGSLQQLTSDSSRQQARITTLRASVGKKFDELGRTVTMMRAGQNDAARTLVLSDQGLLLMLDIHHGIGELQAEEDRLLRGHRSTNEASLRRFSVYTLRPGRPCWAWSFWATTSCTKWRCG